MHFNSTIKTSICNTFKACKLLEYNRRVIKIEINLEEKNTNNEELVTKLQVSNAVSLSLEKNYGKVFHSYNSQTNYIVEEIQKGIDEIEEELVEKWDFQSRLYVTDSENTLVRYLYDKIEKKYLSADDISELKDEKFLNNIKKQIIKSFDKELNKYGKEYDIEKYEIDEIKEDIETLVSEKLEDISTKLFNNKARNKVEKLCDQWEKYYKKEKYEKADDIATEIVEFCDRPNIYKDDELEIRVKTIMAKNELAQNKLSQDKDGKLSELEEEIIEKFMNNDIKEEISKRYD